MLCTHPPPSLEADTIPIPWPLWSWTSPFLGLRKKAVTTKGKGDTLGTFSPQPLQMGSCVGSFLLTSTSSSTWKGCLHPIHAFTALTLRGLSAVFNTCAEEHPSLGFQDFLPPVFPFFSYCFQSPLSAYMMPLNFWECPWFGSGFSFHQKLAPFFSSKEPYSKLF